MKKTLTVALTILSLASLANEIEGTLMLKGALKTKVMVNDVKTTCKLKVEKVTNILDQEDSFGNPGYKAKINISLSGSDFERSLKIKLDKDLLVDNMFIEGGKKIVKDLEYKNVVEKVTVQINDKGHLVETTFPYQGKLVRCTF